MTTRNIKILNSEDPAREIWIELVSGKGTKYRLFKDSFIFTDIFPPEDLVLGCIRLRIDGVLFLKEGYAGNGANFVFDTDSVIRGSLFHDALCELVAIGKLSKKDFKQINDIYRDLCKQDGAWEIRYKFHRLGLRKRWQGLFG